MQVEKLHCVNFRNLENITIIPDSGMNVICGENAQGKTNIIEALWLFTGAKSFRNTKDSAFIRFGEKKAICETQFLLSGVKNSAKMSFDEKRTVELNEKKLPSPAKMAGNFNAIIFSPTDLLLVTAGPSERRKFLDIAIGQLYPNYIEILKSYNRAVYQRNQIIKEYRYDGSVTIMLDVFEKEIADCGKKIISYRKEYIETIKKYLPAIYSGISSGSETIESVYVANCESNILEEKLKEARKDDMFSGVTTVGPHRDDIEFLINGISARNYGSQGQKRSVSLSLKFSQAEVIKEISGEYPICLLDDVLSELDLKRQNYILNHIKEWQSFITCCDPSNTENLENGKIIRIENGGIK